MIRVVKIGGNVIDDSEALKRFLKDFAEIENPKILVHGGGKEASRLCVALGIEPRMVGGRRVTDRDTLDVVTMVYAGLINKRIVSLLQSYGCDAVGLSGADGNVIRASMRAKEPVDYGYVGDIDSSLINAGFIESLLKEGLTPVFCAINHDGKGTLLNCNADSVATAVAIASSSFSPVALTFCFEKEGVLADVDDPSSVIAAIDSSGYFALKERGAISGGMIPKVENALDAVAKGVESVTIKSSSKLTSRSGTVITR